MMEITKQDFEILFWIEYMNYNNPKLLSGQLEISEQKIKNKLLNLEKEELIKIEYRENKIYGSQLTEKGKEIWNNEKYDEWKEELGY